MFDLGITELMVIMVVALIVIGPERLPKVARTLGHLWGRAQRYVNSVKADIERDMAVDEFRQLQQKVQAEASAVEDSFKHETRAVDRQMQEITEQFAKMSSDTKAVPEAQNQSKVSNVSERPTTSKSE